MSLPVNQDQSLYQLKETMLQLFDLIEKNEGIIDGDVEALLPQTEEALAKKVDGYKSIIDRCKVEAEYFDALAKEKAALSKRFKNLSDVLTRKLLETMSALGTKELVGESTKAVLSTTKGRLTIDESKLDVSWKTQEVSWTPDKEKIRKALEQFQSIPGATIEGGLCVRFFASNKLLNKKAKDE